MVDIRQVNQLFRRMSGIQSVNMCKLEFVGIEFTSTNTNQAITGMDLMVGAPYIMNTTQNTNEVTGTGATDRIIAAVIPSLISLVGGAGLTTKASSIIAYQTPLYLDNLNLVNYMRVKIMNSLQVTFFNNATIPAYSIEFKVTPIMT